MEIFLLLIEKNKHVHLVTVGEVFNVKYVKAVCVEPENFLVPDVADVATGRIMHTQENTTNV
jgi:hypothetical protein